MRLATFIAVLLALMLIIAPHAVDAKKRRRRRKKKEKPEVSITRWYVRVGSATCLHSRGLGSLRRPMPHARGSPYPSKQPRI